MIPRTALLAWLAVSGLFLAVTAYYIGWHHVVPMSRDQWHMLHALFGQGLWETSITTVSGHRHLLAFLLYDIDLRWFGGNNHFLVAVDWLLNLGLVAVICRLVWQCVLPGQARLLLCGWTVLLLCWLLNIALLGWGFNGINNYLSIVNNVLALWCLHRAVHDARHRRRDTVLALMLAGLATFSFGNGILAWPIALVSLYLWRAPGVFLRGWAVAMAIFLALYLLLPGGGAVGEALRFNGWAVLLFPLKLMGGPLYHLLRAWHVLPDAALEIVSTGFGVLVTLMAVAVLWQRLRRRAWVDSLDAIAIGLVLLGFGTTVLLGLTRVEGVLDPAVDRFQVWALLVWLGLSLLLYRSMGVRAQRRWQVAFLLFPVLAFPAQLDWGARLAEYRSRVDAALLAYQVYLPVTADAEKALHWNWENKLPYLFPVLEILRERQLNVFSHGAAGQLGRPLPDTTGLRACDWALLRREPVLASEVMNVAAIPGAESYRLAPAAAGEAQGERWWAQTAETGWDIGWLASADGKVTGLVQPVRHSRLPRSSGLRQDHFNAYGIARQPLPPVLVILLQAGHPLCRAEVR